MMDNRNSQIRTDLVLGLDPSSTVIGYGALTRAGRLIEAGLIKPRSGGDASWERVCAMAEDMGKLLDTLRPGVILVEWTKGKVNTHRHSGLGAGLAVYGCGVGVAAERARAWAAGHPPAVVEAVLENDWTRGVAKHERQLAMAAAYPEYGAQVGADPGGDISDGIGLAHWWIQERRVDASLFEDSPKRT